MMKIMKLPLIIILCSQLGDIYSTSFINPLCFPWDTQCLTTVPQRIDHNFITRLPELENLKIDPLEIDYFKIDRDGLLFETRGTKVYGLNNVIIEEFSADESTNSLRMKFRTDLLATGLYKANGSMLFMPVCGEGAYSASLKNLVVDVFAPYKIVKNENGEDLLEASNYKFDYDVKDSAEFRLNNLSYGFPGLSEMLHFLINYNWKYVSSHYAKEFIANAAAEVVKAHKSYICLNPFKFIVQNRY